MKREEYNELCRSMERDIALRAVDIKQTIDSYYGTFFYVGVPAQKEQAKRQWEEAKERDIEKELRYARQTAEIMAFGADGRAGALKLVEEAETQNASPKRARPNLLLNLFKRSKIYQVCEKYLLASGSI